MCFHPWSDVTLPLMSTDEILEVIREWIRQYQEMSQMYCWVQVIDHTCILPIEVELVCTVRLKQEKLFTCKKVFN